MFWNWRRSIGVLTLVLAACTVIVQGQSTPPAQASGSISGKVTDPQGGVVPGVTVTVAGPSLQVPLVTVTRASGAYQFPIVPIGTFSVTFELSGFKKAVRPNVVIVDKFNARIDYKMEVGDVRTEVTVTAAPPVVDVKKVNSGATFTKDILESTPTAPDPWQVIIMTPGVQAGLGAGAGRAGGGGNVGGSSSGQQTSLSARGASSNVQWNLEGGTIGNFDSFESMQARDGWPGPRYYPPNYPLSGESYAHIPTNRFRPTLQQPLSTFGADVDTASYTNTRRFLSSGQLPPVDAVRVEEFVNYFHFAYDEPRGGKPIALTTELGDCPWAPSHKLVLIGARARASQSREAGARNIVLLIDVSGSMQPQERLPLIKAGLSMFVDTLRPDDQIAIVTYAGTSGLALPSTQARHRDEIQRVIASLSAGGSTNGGEGIQMAYRVATESYIPGGVNRVILATDGDFNVGVVNHADLQRLIEHERDSGVFLSVFGVGRDNLKDSTMEMLADKGNGHYAYLDSIQEARRVLLREADSTLENVAKDVKFQVEFNPARVAAWRQVGYEDRQMAAADFNNDRKDGGEMGAGHTVTALYEIVPVGADISDGDRVFGRPTVDESRYQAEPPASRPPAAATAHADEWLNVKARYKQPEGAVSDLIEQPVRSGTRIQNLPFAEVVAEFGMLLRNGSRDDQAWDDLSRRVHLLGPLTALGDDGKGFVELVDIARGLARMR